MDNFNSFLQLKHKPTSDETNMQLALSAAELAKSKGDEAIGAALVWANKNLTEHDTTYSDLNPLKKAGINVINKSLETMPHKTANGILYCTLEPDALTVLSANQAGINEVVFGAYDSKNGFVSSEKKLNLEIFGIKYKGGILSEKCFDMLSKDAKEYCSVASFS